MLLYGHLYGQHGVGDMSRAIIQYTSALACYLSPLQLSDCTGLLSTLLGLADQLSCPPCRSDPHPPGRREAAHAGIVHGRKGGAMLLQLHESQRPLAHPQQQPGATLRRQPIICPGHLPGDCITSNYRRQSLESSIMLTQNLGAAEPSTVPAGDVRICDAAENVTPQLLEFHRAHGAHPRHRAGGGATEREGQARGPGQGQRLHQEPRRVQVADKPLPTAGGCSRPDLVDPRVQCTTS